MKRSHDPDAASTSKQRKECEIEKILSDVCIPEHIWKIIFSLMRGQNKLLELRSANKFFDSLITSKIYSEKLWEKLSYQHKIIPWHSQIAASVQLLNFSETDETIANHERWRRIYFGYRKWVQTPFSKRSPELFSLIRTESMSKKFTCVAAWGSFTASAINKGMISIFSNSHHLTELSLPTLSRHLKVEKLEFWKQRNAPVIIYGRLENGQVLFWNMSDGEIINSNVTFYENIRCWTIELDESFTESLICHIPIYDIVLLAEGQQLFMLTPGRYFDEVRYHISTFEFQKAITSLKMFCNCIIIGCVDGTIRTVYIDDYQTYEKHGHGADTTETEYTLDVENNAIIDIDISTNNNYKLYIVAVTKSTTYQLTFE
ncbi:hypothetical protein KQX54_004802 [Cotesia glomerata]|uniref:F-box domain-containing protein n=1 Tax=Cotesia glomerata TaxID=32391 RepID=A0AAV7HBL4_COTGL|nr:hypothetical protein KQX54_004802 [Cotesia glomerata]